MSTETSTWKRTALRSHQAQVPELARRYFADSLEAAGYAYDQPVLIAQTFSPDQGWRRHPTRKRVSGSWLRGLRAEGKTHVALSHGGRTADFSIRELLSTKAVPLFPGRLV